MTTKPGPRGELARLKEVWRQINSRCHDPRNKDFRYYGARGIVVSDRWRESFANFLEDIGPRPEGLTLDRIDVDGPYAPGNVRWATRADQNRNQRPRTPATHCRKGLHAFTPENTYTRPSGARRCRACRTAYDRRRARELRRRREDILAQRVWPFYRTFDPTGVSWYTTVVGLYKTRRWQVGPPSLVQYVAAGPLVPYGWHARCRTCTHPRRAEIELLLAKGVRPSRVNRVLDVDVPRDSMRNHLTKEHLRLDLPGVREQVNLIPLPSALADLVLVDQSGRWAA